MVGQLPDLPFLSTDARCFFVVSWGVGGGLSRHLDGEQYSIPSRPDQQQYMRAFCHGPITQRTQPAAPLLSGHGQQYRAHFVDHIKGGMREEDWSHAAAFPRAAMRASTHALIVNVRPAPTACPRLGPATAAIPAIPADNSRNSRGYREFSQHNGAFFLVESGKSIGVLYYFPINLSTFGVLEKYLLNQSFSLIIKKSIVLLEICSLYLSSPDVCLRRGT